MRVAEDEVEEEGLETRCSRVTRERRSNDACAVILSRFYRNKMRNFIKDVNPEIKFRFYEDKTEDENYCSPPPSLHI